MKSLLLLLGCLLAAGVGAETCSIPELSAPNPLIDGDLTESCWQRAAKTGEFRNLQGGPVAEKTRALVFCDRENLYVGFTCDFPDNAAKEKEVAEAGKNVFLTDGIEVFLDPGSTGKYSQIAVNLAGNSHLLRIRGPIRYGVQLRKGKWTAELKIPFRSLELPDAEFHKDWKLNFARGNPAIKEWTTWAPLRDSFHDPDRFYTVAGIDADLTKLREEQRKAEAKICELVMPRLIFDVQKEIDLVLNLNFQKSLKNFRLAAVIRGGKEEVVAEKEIRPVFFKNAFSLPVGTLPDGKYHIAVALYDADGKKVLETEKPFWKIPPKTSKQKDVFTIENQCMYRNGEFFFPIIIPEWPLNLRCSSKDQSVLENEVKKGAEWYYRTQDERSRDIKEHGFNTVSTLSGGALFLDQNPKDLEKYVNAWESPTVAMAKRMGITFEEQMRRLAGHGLYLIITSPYISREISEKNIDLFVRQMLKYRDMDNIMAWASADETDGQPEWNRLRKSLYRSLDPDRPVWLNVIAAVTPNRDAADILSTDPYPIPDGVITTVSGNVDRLIAETKGNPHQTQWLWLQNFGDEGWWTRPPNPAELQVMTTLALNHGVKGLAYFTYVEPERRALGKRQNPAGWEALKTINARTTELAPVYCLGKRISLGRQGTLDVAVIEYDGKLYVSAANTGKDAVPVARISVPGKKSPAGEVLYENRGIEMKSGVIADRFKGYEVHIYRFPLH